MFEAAGFHPLTGAVGEQELLDDGVVAPVGCHRGSGSDAFSQRPGQARWMAVSLGPGRMFEWIARSQSWSREFGLNCLGPRFS